MQRFIISVLLGASLLAVGCASGRRGDESGSLTSLKPAANETPLEVRDIEDLIDQNAVIIANEAEIYVSKNYEYDVSLTGDFVSGDLDDSGLTERLAKGKPVAFIRNLKIQCDQRLRVRIADFGTRPFISVKAKGHCSHIVLSEDKQKHAIKRANGIIITNDEIRYFGEVAAPTTAVSPEKKPAGL